MIPAAMLPRVNLPLAQFALPSILPAVPVAVKLPVREQSVGQVWTLRVIIPKRAVVSMPPVPPISALQMVSHYPSL